VERTAAAAIRRITLAEAYEIREEVLRRGGSWPKAPGLPLVGNFFSMNRDLPGFLVNQYRELGPVFEIGAFNRKFVVLAGAGANQFLTRRDNNCLRSWETWADFNTALGTTHNIVSNDGYQHTRWRRTLQYGYSREFIEGRLPDAIEVAKRQLDQLPLNTPLTVNQTCQLLFAEQIGILSAGATPGQVAPYLKDISGYLKVMLLVHVVKRWPPVMQRLPRMRRYRQRMEELYRAVLTSRSPGMRQGCPRDLVDDILDLHTEDPTFLPETNLFSTLVGPYMVGIETAANALSFLFYALLKSPGALARAKKEADEFFAAESPTAEGVRKMTDIHNAVLETLRLYPVVPALLRHAANSFEFGGHYIPAGTSLLFALCVPHYLEEHYPNPLRFDIDRFAPGRQEHAAPGVFAPFSLGPHSCLGQGYAQTLLTVNVAILLHHLEISLAPPDYQLKINHNATSRPADSFKFRIVRRRQSEG
jgi:cytochrome P450